jgi:hypothetical protein
MSITLLTGQFIIRTYKSNNLVTARDGGHHTIDALISSGTSPGANDKFTFDVANSKVFLRTAGNYLLSAAQGGGVGASNDSATFQTERRELADDALFALDGPATNGAFTIATLDGHFVTAVGGGGHPTRAFHTDATVASTWEKFYLLKTGDLDSGHQYAIRPAGTGNIPGKGESLSFLTAINGGNRVVHAMTAQSNLQPESRFHIQKQPDGTYALRTSNGFTVVTADNGGGLAHGTPQQDNLLTNQSHVEAWEKFRIVEVSTGLYTIQTVSGFYVAVKNDFTNISTRISVPDEAPSIGYTAKFELIMTSI